MNEIELNILFLLIAFPNKRPIIFEKLKSKYFIDITNRKIFNIAKKLYEQKLDFDNVIIYQNAKDDKKIINKRLSEILLNVNGLSPLAESYCKELFNAYVKYRSEQKLSLSEMQELLEEKKNVESTGKILHISENITPIREYIEKQSKSKIVTGYEYFDSKQGALLGGDFIILAARPSMGKTAFALNIASNLTNKNYKVLIFSLEMRKEQLENRYICLENGLNSKRVRDFNFSEDEIQAYEKGQEFLKYYNLYVVDEYKLTTEKIEQYCTIQKENEGLDFVIVDHLGLIRGNSNRPRIEVVTDISRDLKLIANKLNVPILCLSQLSRSLESRDDKRPKLSDLRDSGAIEQDADSVWFLYRDGYYNTEIDPRKLELFNAKNRNGALCTAMFDFNLETQKIKGFR